MHMADALLSPAVGAVMNVVSVGAVAYSVKKIKKEDLLEEKKIPMMGIMGAFVFAAQMINFTIPVTGSSGHIGGGILLAAILGSYPALLSITAVLLIQCLFFADGGLLALGCNIFNMGVIPCFFAYPLIYKVIVKKGMTAKNITIASIVSVVIGLQVGAFGVVIETLASGITQLPFGAFVAMMQPIHLAIGLVEGIVTATVLCFVYNMRPETLDGTNTDTAGASIKKVVLTMVAFTIVVGGGLSLFASANPDGLEWSMEKVSGTTEFEAHSQVHNKAASIQESTAFLPDYAFKNDDSVVGTSTSGIVGGALTLALAGVTGVAITATKRKRKSA